MRLDVALLESTFAAVAPRGAEVVERFYAILFERHPEARILFAGVDFPSQRKKLLASLALVVGSVRDLGKLAPVLREMGRKHVAYGALPAHYPAVSQALLDAMAEVAGPLWTTEVADTWTAALSLVCAEMLAGAEAPLPRVALPAAAPAPLVSVSTPSLSSKEAPMTMPLTAASIFDALPVASFLVDADGRITAWNTAAAKLTGRSAAEVVGQKAWRGFSNKRCVTPIDEAFSSGEPVDAPFRFVTADGDEITVTARVTPTMGDGDEPEGAAACLIPAQAADNAGARMRAAIEGSTVAIMMVNRDLVITYVNPATNEVVRKNAAHFATAFPGFSPDRMVGTCIDVFHKNPSHQRRLLADPNNLPVATDIHVGPVIFRINVSAMRDDAGAYVGASLEWKDVTDVRRAEDQAASMKAMADGSGAHIMMCDLERRVTYVNPSCITMLGKYAPTLRKRFPTFDVNNLIGQSIDIFHANPQHQARIFKEIGKGTHRTEISVGGLEFGLNLTTLYDARGSMIGSAVEWFDNNARAEYRRQVTALYDAAKGGQLEFRGDLNKMDDVYRPMLSAINDIVDALLAPIAEIQEKLCCVSGGDLTSYVTRDYPGDHGKLKNALNGTLDSLNEIMGQVRVSADQIASGSSQVASSSQALSGGATKQAAAVEEITASISEMTDQTRKNAENAAQASQLASAAGDLAQTGDTRMKSMVRAMAEIDESSQNISKIIKVIDEIAFQTNLLALNAAVEAARAGVHGKGFAVVAEEVRNLAARSANAAKETTAMIEGSIKKVGHGTNIAEETAVALSRIVDSVGKVKDLVAEIAAASNEQAQGITQVDQGLKQVDQVTQQNTAGAEQSASAADELSSQAARLRELLGRFTLKPAESARGNVEFTPELVAMFEAYLKSQAGGGTRPAAKAAFTPAPTAPRPGGGNSASKRVTPEQARGQGGYGNGGGDFIALTDDEFGRY